MESILGRDWDCVALQSSTDDIETALTISPAGGFESKLHQTGSQRPGKMDASVPWISKELLGRSVHMVWIRRLNLKYGSICSFINISFMHTANNSYAANLSGHRRIDFTMCFQSLEMDSVQSTAMHCVSWKARAQEFIISRSDITKRHPRASRCGALLQQLSKTLSNIYNQIIIHPMIIRLRKTSRQ